MGQHYEGNISIVPSTSEVGVDRPMKALSIFYKSHKGEKCPKCHSCHFFKLIFGTKLLHANVQCVYILKANYHIAPSKAVVGVDRPMKALSMLTQKPY